MTDQPAPAGTPAGCAVRWLRWADLDEEPPVSAAEAARAATYTRADDARRSRAAAWLLRRTVGELLGIAPTTVEVARVCQHCGGPHGRPLIGNPQAPHVSVTHSGDWVGVAASYAGPVGLDVELVDPVVATDPAVAGIALTAAEQAVVAGSTVPAHAFTTYWVRKEAILKATGHGLRVEPREVVVSAPDVPAALLRWPWGDPEGVTLASWNLDERHAAALAVLAPGPILIAEQQIDARAVHRWDG